MKQNILEGNKLIALFMGGTFESTKTKDYMFIPNHGAEGYDADCLSYHSSWDWLMPVVEKISTLTVSKFKHPISVTIKKDFCLISYTDSMYEQTITIKSVKRGDCETTLGAVYAAIADFIQWYNKEFNETKHNRKQ